MGYYSFIFKIMAKKLNTEEILTNINNKIKNLGNSIEFPGFSNKLEDIKKLKIKLKNIETGEKGEITYKAFMRNGWISKSIKSKNISISKSLNLDDGLKLIENHINNLNSKNENKLEFLGIVNSWMGKNKTKIRIKCLTHNNICTPLCSNFLKQDHYFCPDCIKEEVSNRRKLTPEKAQKLVYETKSEEYLNKYDCSLIKDTYTEYKNLVSIICPTHGLFNVQFRTLISNKPNSGICPKCLTNLLDIIKAEENVKNLILDKNEKYKLSLEFLGFEKWNGNKTKLILKCNIHNITWNTTSYNNFEKSSVIGCPICSKHLIHESRCIKIVEDLGFKIDSLKIKSENKISNRKYFIPDIYIPSINSIIEYDGIQHYNYTKQFHSNQQDFVNQINRDNCLVQYCKENNIRLLRIPWKDNNRLEEVIKAFLVEGKDITTKVEPKLLPAVIIK